MNAIILVLAIITQTPQPPLPGKVKDVPKSQQALANVVPSIEDEPIKRYGLDYMTTQQQKEWLLAHLMADLHFNDKKIADWEKKLGEMTPTQIAVAAKAYALQQEKKRLDEERSYAMRLMKMQLAANQSWYRSYYKYKSYSYTTTPCYWPGCGLGGGYGGWGYGSMYPIRLPVVIHR